MMQAGAASFFLSQLPAAMLNISASQARISTRLQNPALTILLFCGTRQFYDHFKQQHVDPLLLTSSSGRATATCLCLVTPDGERTMRTHLGASSELVKADQLPNGWTNNCRLLHCEGYCLYKLDLTRGAMQAAKQSGAEVHSMATYLTPR